MFAKTTTNGGLYEANDFRSIRNIHRFGSGFTVRGHANGSIRAKLRHSVYET